jgi:hypothetical protein
VKGTSTLECLTFRDGRTVSTCLPHAPGGPEEQPWVLAGTLYLEAKVKKEASGNHLSSPGQRVLRQASSNEAKQGFTSKGSEGREIISRPLQHLC